MIHFFDTDIAKKYGVNAAVILQNLAYWCAHNEANGTNYHDGRYWTYNSQKAFEVLFPYLTAKQIRTAIDKLIENGLIITGNYNQYAYDRTLWYALTEKGKSICPVGQMEMPVRANGIALQGEPIPDRNTDINTDIKTSVAERKTASRFHLPTLQEVKDYCLQRQNNVDAERFIDYYTSNGWRVGKNPMKDWKAAVRTWERQGWNGYGYGGRPQQAAKQQIREAPGAYDVSQLFSD